MKPIEYLEEVMVGMMATAPEEIERAVDVLRAGRDAGAMVWIVGNGGSAATASHLANDLVKACGVRAIALADQTPTVLAYGNDEGWDGMFGRLVARLSNPEDVLVAISTSGASPNVVEMVRAMGRIHPTIALTGPDRNSNVLGMIAGVVIRARHGNIRVQEDVHMAVCHAIVSMLAEGE